MAAAGTRCAAIGATLRLRLSRLNVRHRPDPAPTVFITPTTIKNVLKSGPMEQLLFCACDSCHKYSRSSADERKQRYQKYELPDEYVTVFALLLKENCAGLIWEFQKKTITLDRPIFEQQLDFLMPLLSGPFTTEEVIDVVSRITKSQFCFFARPLERGVIEKEYDPREALPIEEDETSVGKGGFGEVFAFKILEEYKGAGYKAFANEKFARKIFKSNKQESGLDEWCKLMQIHNLIGKPHDHIVETLGAFQYGNTFSIIFHLAERNLGEYLQTDAPFFSNYLWAQMQGVSEGLAYLHGLQDSDVDGRSKDTKKNERQKDSITMAYHLDLKPDNILIMDGKMQIADFGLSKVRTKLMSERFKYESSGLGDQWGYMTYAPPEYPRTKHYVGHDIWSLGAIFSEVATHDIHLTGAGTKGGQKSVEQYRTRRQIDEQSWIERSLSFHNGSEVKNSVCEQHQRLREAAGDKRDTELWQSIFYQEKFFELVTQMLAKDPTTRSTASDVASTLAILLKETTERQKKSSGHLRYSSSEVPTIWEEAQSRKLQSDYGKLMDAPFLTAYCQIPKPLNQFTLMRCVIFPEERGEDLNIQLLYHTQDNRNDRTEKNFFVSRDIPSHVTGIVPLYATRPSSDVSPGITIDGLGTNSTFRFEKPEELDDFQRLLLHQYPVSKFYRVSEINFQGKLLHKSIKNHGDLYLQLWCNHDISGSRRHYEDIRHIAKVALLAPGRLCLIRVWDSFKMPSTTSAIREKNPVKLDPSHGDLNTHDIEITNDLEYKMPIGLDAPRKYSTRFKYVSITFADPSDVPNFWNDLETLQKACTLS